MRFLKNVVCDQKEKEGPRRALHGEERGCFQEALIFALVTGPTMPSTAIFFAF